MDVGLIHHSLPPLMDTFLPLKDVREFNGGLWMRGVRKESPTPSKIILLGKLDRFTSPTQHKLAAYVALTKQKLLDCR